MASLSASLSALSLGSHASAPTQMHGRAQPLRASVAPQAVTLVRARCWPSEPASWLCREPDSFGQVALCSLGLLPAPTRAVPRRASRAVHPPASRSRLAQPETRSRLTAHPVLSPQAATGEVKYTAVGRRKTATAKVYLVPGACGGPGNPPSSRAL